MSDTFFFLHLESDHDVDGDSHVEGEATAAGFVQDIEVEGFSWEFGAEKKDARLGSLSAEGGTTAQSLAEGGFVTINKFYDYASADLNLALKNNEEFSSARLTMATVESSAADLQSASDGSPRLVPVFQFDMKKIRVQSIDLRSQDAGSSAVSLTETVKLSYKEFVLRYFPPAGWDETGYAKYDISDYNEASRQGKARQAPREFDPKADV